MLGMASSLVVSTPGSPELEVAVGRLSAGGAEGTLGKLGGGFNNRARFTKF